jgi:hypothetical protein
MIFSPNPTRDIAMEAIQEPGLWQIWSTLVLLLETLGTLVLQLAGFGLHWVLWIVWVAWWLGAVNAKKARYVVAYGGWAPAIVLMVLAALVWSRLAPQPFDFLGLTTVPIFWWHLGYVCLLALTALFCGWLQSVWHWTPPDIHFEPPAHGHGHDHGHGHPQHH